MPVKRKKAKPKTKARAKAKKKVTRRPKGKAWSAAEINKLKVGYKSKPASKIAKELKRSLASVRGKISALGLTKGPAKKKAPIRRKPRNLLRVATWKKAARTPRSASGTAVVTKPTAYSPVSSRSKPEAAW